ncbi:N-formylglutamate amidohydrolase [Bordetella holmesii]|uniref:N-formylglutamate amidohydrolase n=2 Tax=Bordetella holmesii TaxID=35814 RepID=A0A158M351_9BORD|nr:N-formylglutamate amidohydrolase [Bordetella holmesii]AHV91184.1 N-formylglutamate amidohydrolase [Bordetella holmesii ATCC 51541]AIT27275.1 N-formylglutamate amidohydrolase [Bordetella holmesii 44057]EWM42207.1 N-formylglutamate amidohydrolase [Bordetella holmesii 41130]EWM47860.1 N-formylglutamate amidohydrolase [Bordetella holmesii 35009]AMD46127.1 N-formylglutamate amidohydrolase [Bordetella holmesii H558]
MPIIHPLSYRLDLPQSFPQAAPLVLDSPHSGTSYPPDFAASVDFGALRTAEDTWVDDLWGDAIDLGVPLIAASFPRAYIDANRSAEEVDPLLLDTPWDGPMTDSPKVKLGKGLIWRMLDDGTPLYDRKLSIDEVRHRINACWKPYHAKLAEVLDQTHAHFGKVWHINCHSMPSVAGAFATDRPGLVHPDFVLGDRDGSTSDPAFREFIAKWLRQRGYNVTVNDPYKGVELVRAFGNPAQGRHSLQIEINRKLYMDEVSLRPTDGYPRLKSDLRELTAALIDWTRAQTA